MPRKTRRATTTSAWSPGFNEAAARCRGKPRAVLLLPLQEGPASMRPRPDAAENPPDARSSYRRENMLQ